ncbi:DUF4440 domain-containing protein [bacterium]|nr:DUF4440 domain-containing protein [bacterium]
MALIIAGAWLTLAVGAVAAPADDILQVMRDAEAGWNVGDLEKYMDCYWRSEKVRFAGGDKVSYGWEAVLGNYRKGYPDRTAMGVLTFSEMDVMMLAPDAAVVFGRWRLERADDEPHGLFTLVFRSFDGKWRIVHDHTSSAAPPAAD